MKDTTDIDSTTRFNHALGVAEFGHRTTLLTHTEPPSEIMECFSSVKVIDDRNPAFSIGRAIKTINSFVQNSIDAKLITAAQFEPLVAGKLSNAEWVVDLYDDPLQGIRNNPISHHQFADRFKKVLIKLAPDGINTLHCQAPHKAGINQKHCINGSPVQRIQYRTPKLTSPIRSVIAGKTTLGKGMGRIIDGLKLSDADIQVNAYGEVNDETIQYSESMGVTDQLAFYGSTPHSEVKRAITDAHVGLCILPPRKDWVYHYPIKLGEYLAGGTVPLASDFPGLKQMGKDSALYVNPSPIAIAAGLENISSLSTDRYKQLSHSARKRGEEISWEKMRLRFAQKAFA